MITRLVFVNDIPKGEIFRYHGRWRWWKSGRGAEEWKKGTSLTHIKSHIARVCLVEPDKVRISYEIES